MKAAVLNDIKGSFDIENVQIDSPKGREVLVQVKASGLCHTDHYMAVNPFGFPLPALLGKASDQNGETQWWRLFTWNAHTRFVD
jgi:Zn-dependent alcohol dehydrogenase